MPLTSRKLKGTFNEETETDVSLKVEETENPEVFLVSGRGELHLAILIENMRQEGAEFQVSKPNVILKEIEVLFKNLMSTPLLMSPKIILEL